jgi:hypothetical protein
MDLALGGIKTHGILAILIWCALLGGFLFLYYTYVPML